MNGWKFVEEYTNIIPKLKKKIILYILSSSVADEDIRRGNEIEKISDYVLKPITKNMFKELLETINDEIE